MTRYAADPYGYNRKGTQLPYPHTSSLDQFRKLWMYTPTPMHIEAHVWETIILNLAHVNRLWGEVVLKEWLETIEGREPETFMISLDKKRFIRQLEEITD